MVIGIDKSILDLAFQRLAVLTFVCVLVTGLLAASLPAQVVLVRDFNISSSRDRTSLFATAVSPSGQVLSFIAKNTGNWELHRVSNWLGRTPSEEELVLPGFFSKKDQKDLEILYAKVFVTGDGAYAVCVGSAEWLKRVQGWAVGNPRSDDVISIVDLKALKVVSSARTGELGLLEFHDVRLDSAGHVLVQSLSWGKSRTGAFVQLDIPSLKAGPRCSYNWSADSSGRPHPTPTTERECGDALKSLSLEQYLKEKETPVLPDWPACERSNSDFCRLSSELTPDGKFAIGYYSTGHDNFWGDWVTTDASVLSYIIIYN